MLNYIWATLLFIGLLVAGLVGRVSGDASVIDAAMKGAEKAVMGIALPLAGMMMFWLGVLRLLEKAGVLEAVVRVLSPLLRRLFPDVPTGHPAMSAIVMNLSANMLGLSNNATPLGLKAMGHLQELNPHKQSASNAMITFLALNTGAFTLIPMTAMNFLNAAGVSHSFRVIVPTILATACASVAAVIAAKSFQRLPGFVAQPDEVIVEGAQSTTVKPAGMSDWAKLWLIVLGTLFLGVSALELGPPSWRQRVLDRTGLSAVLEKGQRGVSITVAAESASGGFVVPNDHVDVILTRSTAKGQTSESILTNVRVLAINARLGETGTTGAAGDGAEAAVADPKSQVFSGGAIATLALTPDQADTVINASQLGKLSLSLRSIIDFAETVVDDAPTKRNAPIRLIRYGQETNVMAGATIGDQSGAETAVDPAAFRAPAVSVGTTVSPLQ